MARTDGIILVLVLSLSSISVSAAPLVGVAGEMTLSEAFDVIRAAHVAHSELPAILELEPALRASYVAAHLTLARAAEDPGTPKEEREKVREAIIAFYRDLLTGETEIPGGEWLRRSGTFAGGERTMAFLREIVLRTYKDLLPDTAEARADYAEVTGLEGVRLRLFETYNLLLLDNSALTPSQLAVIENLLALIPRELHDSQAIGVVELLGEFPAEISWWDLFSGKGAEINIPAVEPGAVVETPFPPDVPQSEADLFLSVLAHELNHVVDAFHVQMTSRATRDRLLAEASCDPQNFLRSTFPPCFFATAPQEFFASIANIWFADTERTLDLAIRRFNAGWRMPLDQFLFFLDIYSLGGPTSFFYVSDRSGSLSRSEVRLERDAENRLTAIFRETQGWRFIRNASGEIIAIQAGAGRRRAVGR